MTNNLRHLRRERGLAAWGVAVKSGVSTATLTAIEKWNYVPKRSTQERIANALQVQADEIWPPVDEENAGQATLSDRGVEATNVQA